MWCMWSPCPRLQLPFHTYPQNTVFKLFPFSKTQSKEQFHLYSYMFCFVVRSPFTHFYNLGYYRRVPVYFALLDLTWNKTAVIYGSMKLTCTTFEQVSLLIEYILGYYRRVPVYFAVLDLMWNKTAVIYGWMKLTCTTFEQVSILIEYK